ncbi:alveolin domain containing intermediate filament imc6 [Cystoisospora suis]|uniref:Alveolin domain containing intermediate filament imc6 n=1 Tax=Cystoisospora suis TaxID=483139 RepID=A0A2C6L4R6_9APIC|nr:alveolin domain containing intermediate filament imc6 [Cystoisospora suis]
MAQLISQSSGGGLEPKGEGAAVIPPSGAAQASSSSSSSFPENSVDGPNTPLTGTTLPRTFEYRSPPNPPQMSSSTPLMAPGAFLPPQQQPPIFHAPSSLPPGVAGGSYDVLPALAGWHEDQPQTGGACGNLFGACCPGAPSESYPTSTPFRPGLTENMWRWTRDGKLQLSCGQPIVPVPVIQEIHRRDKIIEVPQVDVVDAVKPKVFNQGVEHEVPLMQIHADHEFFDVEQIRYVEKEVVVPIVTGFTHKFVPKWEIREVPRPVVKYVGKQDEIEVEVPQVQFVDKVVEKEVVVDTIEKKIPKIIEVPKYVDTVKYVWKPVEKIVHVERFVPVFDVSLECPAPLIVPYPVQAVKEMPAVMVRKAVPGAEIDEQEVDVISPPGTVRVPEEYVREYQHPHEEEGTSVLCRCPGGGTCTGSGDTSEDLGDGDRKRKILTAEEMKMQLRLRELGGERILRGNLPGEEQDGEGEEGRRINQQHLTGLHQLTRGSDILQEAAQGGRGSDRGSSDRSELEELH